MRYNIISPGVGARQCRAPTGVPHVNENRYKIFLITHNPNYLVSQSDRSNSWCSLILWLTTRK
ncbi:hypothetical protein H6G95_09980 [Nostoc linckia FACHB-391]|uniref:Uncharacterized protein n=3 Tax=Nostoc TaxID=1177 RepID=A0ABR8IDE9_9NOSO|nr:hypothetical protein [Nostoc linckia]MBD2560943.1 hypothetical protein [Nostoc linckia FACHB-391]MBD2649418.1 hypothetical protein [Nostoc foliaceum FACHB-393]